MGDGTSLDDLMGRKVEILERDNDKLRADLEWQRETCRLLLTHLVLNHLAKRKWWQFWKPSPGADGFPEETLRSWLKVKDFRDLLARYK